MLPDSAVEAAGRTVPVNPMATTVMRQGGANPDTSANANSVK